MSETKHTPGPWHTHVSYLFKNDKHYPIVIRPEGSTSEVAEAVCLGSREQEEIIANAHLIAAAPEMLDALEHYVGYGDRKCKCRDGMYSDSPKKICNRCRFMAVIAKAKGETK